MPIHDHIRVESDTLCNMMLFLYITFAQIIIDLKPLVYRFCVGLRNDIKRVDFELIEYLIVVEVNKHNELIWNLWTDD